MTDINFTQIQIDELDRLGKAAKDTSDVGKGAAVYLYILQEKFPDVYQAYQDWKASPLDSLYY